MVVKHSQMNWYRCRWQILFAKLDVIKINRRWPPGSWQRIETSFTPHIPFPCNVSESPVVSGESELIRWKVQHCAGPQWCQFADIEDGSTQTSTRTATGRTRFITHGRNQAEYAGLDARFIA